MSNRWLLPMLIEKGSKLVAYNLPLTSLRNRQDSPVMARVPGIPGAAIRLLPAPVVIRTRILTWAADHYDLGLAFPKTRFSLQSNPIWFPPRLLLPKGLGLPPASGSTRVVERR